MHKDNENKSLNDMVPLPVWTSLKVELRKLKAQKKLDQILQKREADLVWPKPKQSDTYAKKAENRPQNVMVPLPEPSDVEIKRMMDKAKAKTEKIINEREASAVKLPEPTPPKQPLYKQHLTPAKKENKTKTKLTKKAREEKNFIRKAEFDELVKNFKKNLK